MPKAYYTDPAVLGLERKHLFGREWICIGRVEEIAEPGDYMSFQLCDDPLIAVRGKDRVSSCPVECLPASRHSADGWARQPPAAGLSLSPLVLRSRWKARRRAANGRACDVRQVFLPSPAVPGPRSGTAFCSSASLRTRRRWRHSLRPLEEMIRNYHMDEMKLHYLAEEVWPTNWKCMIENFMEGYHLSPLHRTTLHPVNPTRLCRHFEAGEAYFGYNAGYSPDLPRSQRGHPDLTDAEAGNCVMFAIPPGLVSGCGGDYSSFICVQPETVDRVRAKMGLIFYGEDWPQEAIRPRGHAVQRHHGRGQGGVVEAHARHGLEAARGRPIGARRFRGTGPGFLPLLRPPPWRCARCGKLTLAGRQPTAVVVIS